MARNMETNKSKRNTVNIVKTATDQAKRDYRKQ